MTPYECAYQRYSCAATLTLFALHVPLAAAVAAHFDTGVPLALGVTLLLCAGPALLHWLRPGGVLACVSFGAAAMGLSALLIYLGRGMIELHFHVFVMLAFLVVLARPLALLAAAATIAVHHVLGWLIYPHAVFSYAAGFGVVAVHASFVVVETAVLVVIARMFRRMIGLQGRMGDVVVRAADDVAERSRQLQQAGSANAVQAATQAASLKETAVAIKEIEKMTGRNAQDAQRAQQLASATREAAASKDQAAGLVRLGGQITTMEAFTESSAETARATAGSVEILTMRAATLLETVNGMMQAVTVVPDSVGAAGEAPEPSRVPVPHRRIPARPGAEAEVEELVA